MVSKQYGGIFMPKPVPRNPGDLFDVGMMAEALLYPGQDKLKLTDKLRWFLAQGHLTPVAKETEGRQAYLFLPDQMLVAEVLLRLQEFGALKPETGEIVRRSLSHWNEADKPSDAKWGGPGMHIIRDYEAGARDWTFELWSFVNPENGHVRFEGRIAANQRELGTQLFVTRDQQFKVRAVFAVDLIDVLDRIHPAAKARRRKAN